MKKRGFTLVELLAVIVILGIIMLIATPMIMNVIEDSKRKAFEISAGNIVRAAETEYWNNTLMGPPKSLEFEYSNGRPVSEVLEFNGKNPENGMIYVDNEGYVAMAIHDGTWCAIKDFDTKKISIEKMSKEDCEIEIELEPTDISCFEYEEVVVVEKFDINYNLCMEYFQDELEWDYRDANLACGGEIYEGGDLIELFDYGVVNVYELENLGIIYNLGPITDGIRIVEYLDSCPKDIVIPSKIDDKNVVFIGRHSFAFKDILSVSIPKGVEIIGEYAFNWNHLQSLKIPNTVTKIKSGAFENNQITDLKLSNNIEYLSGFRDNQITSLTIPDSVVEIGGEAFLGNQLTEIIIPHNVIKIYDYAFHGNQITSVSLGSNIKEIYHSAFSYNQLTEVSIPYGIEHLSGFEGNRLTEITIPSSVKIVGFNAFSYNQLSEITIPSGVVTIESFSFWRNNLINVNIPNTVTTIESNAFVDNQLTSISIPDSIEHLSGFNKNMLTEITIPTSVKEIGSNAFESNLLTEVEIPTSVEKIGGWAFNDNQLTEIFIPNNVNEISWSAFRRNKIVQGNAKIDNSVGNITIRSDAFSNNGPNQNQTITPTYLR